MEDDKKPPYRVPSMAEVAAVPGNGLTVASTFSGGGGSCTGYRMAGFRVVWASEFVPAAAETYRANHPETILDTRDIRDVTAADVLAACGIAKGELDLFDGSPPCQSFSTAGRRDKSWGRVTTHGDGSVQRSDDLFFEYVRLLDGLRPRTFIAENVSGLVKGRAKGMFKEIHGALSAQGYQVRARLLDAQWLGVPQERVRCFFVGVRDDLGIEPSFPDPLPYRYSVRNAIGDLCPNLAGQSVLPGRRAPRDRTDRVPSRTTCLDENPDDAERIVLDGTLSVVEPEAWRFTEKGGVIVDGLGPDRNGAGGSSYFGMRRLDPGRPAGTVQASEGQMPSTNQVHPLERRRLSIAELKRICSFPDDYVLTGSYAEQWARLGNSVPPMMMRHIAAVLRDLLLTL